MPLYEADVYDILGEIPPNLPQLTQIEEMLIAQVFPMVSVFNLRGGQLAYRGNIINFPQDINSFVDTLPRDPASLDVFVVRRHSHDGTAFRDFKVCRANIEVWLQWLKVNNPWYKDINIDEEVLQSLPTDGSIYDRLRHISDDGQQHPAHASTDDQDADDGDNDPEDIISHTFVPAPSPEIPEIEAINTALESNQLPTEWPSIGNIPISEFSSQGYMARAFPALYLWGTADLRDARMRDVNPSEYFQHLLRFFFFLRYSCNRKHVLTPVLLGTKMVALHAIPVGAILH